MGDPMTTADIRNAAAPTTHTTEAPPPAPLAMRTLVRLSLLERVSAPLLVRFLRPFEAYLVGRGVALDGVAHDLAWVGQLHTVLTSVDAQVPGALQQALLDVADLASDQGHEVAVSLAGQPQLGLFERPKSTSPEDLALELPRFCGHA
jgi:hypothetical protein